MAMPLVVALGFLLPFLSTPVARAHDIPDDVRVQIHLRPAGDRLTMLVRVPLAAMQEVDIPLRGPGYVDLPRAEPALRTAAQLWIVDNIEIREGDAALPRPRLLRARVSLASDRAFGSFDEALALLAAPALPDDTDLYWNQQLLDLLLDYPIRSERAEFAVHVKVARLGQRVQTILRFLPPDGEERALAFHGDPGLIRLDPRWHQAALRFVASGFRHILEGVDHLLFLACLVIPFRRLAPLALIVTAFTVAHSITLIAAAFGLAPDALWFPPLVETLIAISIVWMALENIFGAKASLRWIVAFAFGLVHGFGFSFALQETLQFAGAHLVTSLLAFNLGVELGQLLVLVLLVPVLDFFLRRVVDERIGVIVLSALVAHTGWHWMLERGEQLLRFPLPVPDAAGLAGLARWLMAAVALCGLVWLVHLAIAHARPERERRWRD